MHRDHDPIESANRLIDESRNERQKSMLLIERARSQRDDSIRAFLSCQEIITRSMDIQSAARQSCKKTSK
jgi:hypothetical protein